ISEVWCHDPVLPSGKASAEQLTAKVYHLAGCATMADPTRTSGSFSPVSCRCLLSSWLRPHWGISQEKLPLDPGFFQFVYKYPPTRQAVAGGADRTAGCPNPPKRRLSDDQERSRLYPEFEFLRLIFIIIIPRISDTTINKRGNAQEARSRVRPHIPASARASLATGRNEFTVDTVLQVSSGG